MTTPEQQAREMLERMGIQSAYQRMSAGELVELANLIDEHDALKAELAAIKGAGEPVAWGQLGMLNGKTYLRENWDRSPYPPSLSIIKNLNLVPLYTRPCAPLTDEQIDELWRAPTYAEREHYEFARAIEAHIKGAK